MKDLIDRLNKFAETSTGKAVLIAVLILLIGIIFFSIRGLLFPTAPATDGTQSQVPSDQVGQPAETPETTQQPTKEVKVSEITQFSLETGFEVFAGDILRDPFKPLITAASTEPTQTTSTAELIEEKPVTLVGVTYEEGVLKAVLGFDGNVVNAGPGDTVGNYMVVSVNQNSARLLYGDQPIFLEVGQSYTP
jgi:hypothetical protein